MSNIRKTFKKVQKNYYNPNNKLLTKDFVESLLKRVTGLDLKIKTMYPYQLAMVHKSVYKKNIAPKDAQDQIVFYQTYESLEFVGDAWFGAIVADYLYHRFPGQDEGFLTKLKTKIVRSEQMADYSRFLGLDEWIIITPRVEKIIGRDHKDTLEDVFEAFCAAIKQDLGIPILEIFTKNLIEATIDFNDMILNNDDFKTLLLQYYQKHGWGFPTYCLVEQDGVGHGTIFTMGVDWIPQFDDLVLEPIVTNDLKCLALGKGTKKQQAEQSASREAFQKFKSLFE